MMHSNNNNHNTRSHFFNNPSIHHPYRNQRLSSLTPPARHINNRYNNHRTEALHNNRCYHHQLGIDSSVSATHLHFDPRLVHSHFDSQSEPSSSFITDNSDDDHVFNYTDGCCVSMQDNQQHTTDAAVAHTRKELLPGLQPQQQDCAIDSNSKQPLNHSPSRHICRVFHLLKSGFALHKKRQSAILKQLFSRWSDVAYEHPYWCIWSTLIVTIILGSGLTPGYCKWVEGADKLYTLQRSTARDDGNLYTLLFQESRVRFNYVIVSTTEIGDPDNTQPVDTLAGPSTDHQRLTDAEKEGRRRNADAFVEERDILRGRYLKIVAEVDSIIRGESLDPLKGSRVATEWSEDFNSQKIRGKKPTTRLNATIDQEDLHGSFLTFRDLCHRNAFGHCETSGILDLILETTQTSVRSPPSSLTSGNLEIFRSVPDDFKPELWMTDGFLIDFVKQAFIPANAYIGGLSSTSCVRPVPSSFLNQLASRVIPKAMLDTSNLHIDLERSQVGVDCVTHAQALLLGYGLKEEPEYEELNEKWESAFLTVMKPLRNHWPNIYVYVNAHRSRDDELKSSTSQSKDATFVGLTFLSLLLYTATVNFSCDLYQSKSFSGVAGTFTAILGLVTGMGLCCHLRLSLVPTALVCPFLVLGIGVDDMFVILNSYSLTFNLAPQQRCRSSLRDSGISVTLTTLTSLISFVIGAWSPYLAVRNFCIFCGTGLLFGYIYVFTFFFPFLCLDAQREFEQRLMCCYPMKHPVADPQQSPSVVSSTGASSQEKAVASTTSTHHADDNFIFVTISQMTQHHLGKKSTTSELQYSDKNLNNDDDNRNAQTYQISRPNSAKRASAETQQPQLGPLNILKQNDRSVDQRVHAGSNDSDVECRSGCCCFPSQKPFQKVHLAVEPFGNVGRRSRSFLLRYYGPFITNRWVKFVVILLFMILLGFCSYGLMHIKFGLELQELAPRHSYLRAFDKQLRKHFSTYDLPVDIFFPSQQTPWWSDGYLEMIEDLQKDLIDSGVASRVISPLSLILGDVRYRGWMLTGDKATFEAALYSSVTDPSSSYIGLQHSFLWQGRELRAWKMVVLPPFMTTSQEKASWMVKIRNVCHRHETFYFHNETDVNAYSTFKTSIRPWNYMMTFFESDLQILYFVVVEMTSAGLTLALVASLGLPDWRSGIIVTGVMALIDLTILGFMHWWNIKLNMISMVNLLLSIGFAVDYSTHIAHTFLECVGPSRNFRVIESLVLMGNPILQGATGCFLGIVMLGFSESHIFQIFFKMMTLIIVFGLSFGVVFLPVTLSIIGTFIDHTDTLPSSVPNQRESHPDLASSSVKSTSPSSHLRCIANSSTPVRHRRSLSSPITAPPWNRQHLDFSTHSDIPHNREDSTSRNSSYQQRDLHLSWPPGRKDSPITEYYPGPKHTSVSNYLTTQLSQQSLPILTSPATSPVFSVTPTRRHPSWHYHTATPTRRAANRETPIAPFRDPHSSQQKLVLPGVQGVSPQRMSIWSNSTPLIRCPKTSCADEMKIINSEPRIKRVAKTTRNDEIRRQQLNSRSRLISNRQTFSGTLSVPTPIHVLFSSSDEDDGDLDSPVPRSTDRRDDDRRATTAKWSGVDQGIRAHLQSSLPFTKFSRFASLCGDSTNHEQPRNQSSHMKSRRFSGTSRTDTLSSGSSLDMTSQTALLRSQALSRLSSEDRAETENVGDSLECPDGAETREQDSEFVTPVPRNLRMVRGGRHVDLRYSRSRMSPSAVSTSSALRLPGDDRITSTPTVQRANSRSDCRSAANHPQPTTIRTVTRLSGSVCSPTLDLTPSSRKSSTAISVIPDDLQHAQWSSPPSLLTGDPMRSLPLPKKFPQNVPELGFPITRPSPVSQRRVPSSAFLAGRPTSVRGRALSINRKGGTAESQQFI